MKKVFFEWTVGAILVAMLGTSAAAFPEKAEGQKVKVRIIVVEKKEHGGSSNSSKSQKPNPENRDKRQ